MEAKDVISTFYELPVSTAETDLVDITLLRNRNVVNDFSIRLTWQGEMPEREKSDLGYQLAEAFSKMGWINHSVWVRETSLFMGDRRNFNERK